MSIFWVLVVLIGVCTVIPAFWPLSKQQKAIRKLMKDNPNPHMYVVGAGTVRMDPKAIRESASFKESMRKVREYARR